MVIEFDIKDNDMQCRKILLAAWSAFRNTRPPVIVFMDAPFYCKLAEVPIEDIYEDPESMMHAQLSGWKRLLNAVSCDNEGPSVGIDFGSCFTGSIYGCDLVHQSGSVPTTHPWLTSEKDVGLLERIDPFSQGLAEKAKHYYHVMTTTSHNYAIEVAGMDSFYPYSDISLMTGSEGPFSIMCMIAGLERVSMWCYENPDLLLRMMHIITDKEIERIQKTFAYMNKPLDRVFLADDYSAYMSEEIYQTFILPFQKKLCDAFPGSPLFHSCIPEKRFLRYWKDDLHIRLFNGFKPQHGIEHLKRDFKPVAETMAGDVLLEADIDGANLMVADSGVLGKAADEFLDVFEGYAGVKLCYTLAGGHSVDDLKKCNTIKQKVLSRTR